MSPKQEKTTEPSAHQKADKKKVKDGLVHNTDKAEGGDCNLAQNDGTIDVDRDKDQGTDK